MNKERWSLLRLKIRVNVDAGRNEVDSVERFLLWKGGILVNKQRCVRVSHVSHDSCKPAFFLLALFI